MPSPSSPSFPPTLNSPVLEICYFSEIASTSQTSNDCRLKVLSSCHDAPAAGHFGSARTLELVKRSYWWPNLSAYVKTYVASCDTCARAKTSRQKPAGLLQPLHVPSRPFSSVGLDFITDLPDSNGSNCILVFVDRLTKAGHFVPCHGPPDAESTAHMFLSTIVRLYGVPDQTIFERGPQFYPSSGPVSSNTLEPTPLSRLATTVKLMAKPNV